MLHIRDDCIVMSYVELFSMSMSDERCPVTCCMSISMPTKTLTHTYLRLWRYWQPCSPSHCANRVLLQAVLLLTKDNGTGFEGSDFVESRPPPGPLPCVSLAVSSCHIWCLDDCRCRSYKGPSWCGYFRCVTVFGVYVNIASFVWRYTCTFSFHVQFFLPVALYFYM